MPTLGQQVRYEPVDVPEPDEPRYREWIPAPSAIETDGADWGGLFHTAPGEVGDGTVGTRLSPLEAFANAQVDHVGIGYDGYEHVVSVGPAVVGLGSFDAEPVREAVLDRGFERVDSYEGYDRFERTDPASAVAVRDGTVVCRRRGRLGERPEMDTIEAVIDAGDGRLERRHEVDEGFDALTRAVGAYPTVQLFDSGGFLTDQLEDELGVERAVHAYAFDDDGVYFQSTYLVDDGLGVSPHHVEDALAHDSRAIDAYAVEVSIDEPFVRVDMQESHEQFRNRVGDAESTVYPRVTWTVEHNGDRLEVTHGGGDSVDAERLTLYYDSRSRSDPGIDHQFGDEFETVSVGDSVVVDVSEAPPDDSVALLYSPPDTNNAAVVIRVPLERT
ncbi:hypothetical protein [Natronobiforma cellulositropha]|uniref:hypothetical protein n=1 Tax=Natronobiforma cellulositropha TaxID=1679076 RepID=UPI0021D5BF01|nr:hypothetical protein [Natronobiforma cellulositropha]